MKNKNKIMLLVMILVMMALVSVSVFAAPLDSLNRMVSGMQTNNILLIIVNTALIFVGLMLVFNLIKKGMEVKQAQVVQIVIAFLSFMFAMEMSKTYPGTLLWKIPYFANLLHVPVIVNTAIIAVGLNLLAEILLEKQMSPGLKWGIRILVVIMALNSAMAPFEGGKTWDDVKADYKYVWKQPFLTNARFYLFGAKGCEYNGESGCYYDKDIEQALGESATSKQGVVEEPRWGVLTPKRIVAFILLLFVLIAAFNSFVKVELFGKKFIYALSFLLAGNLVNTGTTIGTVVLVGQLVLSIVLYRAMKDQFGNKTIGKIFAAIVSFSIVEFATKSIFKEKGKTMLTPIVGEIGTEIGAVFADGLQWTDPFKLIWSILSVAFKHPIGFLIIFGIIIIFMLSKGGVKLGDTGKYLKANFMKRLKGRLKLIGSKLGLKWFAGYKRPIKPDSWPYVMIENRPLLMYNQQWLKRMEIYYNYWNVVKPQIEPVKEMYTAIGRHSNFDVLKNAFVHFRSSDNVDVNELIRGAKKDEAAEIKEAAGKFGQLKGWNRTNEDFIKLMNDTAKFVQLILHRQKNYTIKPVDSSGDDFSQFMGEKFKEFIVRVEKMMASLKLTYDIEWIDRYVASQYDSYSVKRGAYGFHNVIELVRQFSFDLANISSAGGHTYKFVSPDKEFTDGVNLKKGADLMKEYGIIDNEQLIPVDLDYRISIGCKPELNKWRVVTKQIMDPVPGSKIKKPCISDYSDYVKALEWINGDWQEVVNNFRDGRYFKAAKLAETYAHEIVRMGVYHDEKIHKVSSPLPDEGHPAFDLRTMKDIGRITFVSRPYYDSPVVHMGLKYKEDGGMTFAMKDVGVSSRGFSIFLNSIIHRDTEECEELHGFLQTIPADVVEGDAKHTFKTLYQLKHEQGKHG